MTIEALLDRFSRRPRADALVIGNQTLSYLDLLDQIERKTFREIPVGSVVALVGEFDLSTISALFSLWRRDCVVVPMLSLQESRLEVAQVEFVVSQGDATPTGRKADHELYSSIKSPRLVLFTSGSTGTPKAALHNVARWLAKLARPGKAQRTLAFLSFDHIGGLNTLLYALANGGCLVCPEDRSPSTVWSTIVHHGVELLPTTPTFLRLSLFDGPIPPAPSLRLVAYGSEPMPKATLSAAREALPGVEFLQQYGMSELGVLRSRSREDGSTWVRLGGPEFGVRVVDGLLEVSAKTAMVGYLNAPSPFTEDGWLRTGDEAEQDGEYFRILGRRSETINVGGEKVHPAEVEACLEALLGVNHAVVRGEPNPLTGQIVVAAVNLSTNETIEAFRTRMRSELKGKLPRYAMPQRVECLTNAIGERGKKLRAA
jgi:long-chain acyl-CoA synthetase